MDCSRVVPKRIVTFGIAGLMREEDVAGSIGSSEKQWIQIKIVTKLNGRLELSVLWSGWKR